MKTWMEVMKDDLRSLNTNILLRIKIYTGKDHNRRTGKPMGDFLVACGLYRPIHD